MSMRPCYSLFFLLLSLVVQVNLQVDINSVDLLITIIRRAIWTRMLGGFLNVSPSYPRYLLFEATKNLKQSDNAEKIKIVHFVWHYPLFVRTVILQGLDAVRRAVLQKRVGEGRFPKIQQRFSEIRPTPSRKQFFATPPRSSTYPRKMAIFSELPSLESSLTLAAQAKPSLLSHPAPASTLWWDFTFFRLKFVNEHCLLVRARSWSCLDCNSTEAREPHLLWHRVCSSHFDFDTLIFSKVAKDKCDRWGYQQQHPDLFSGEHQQGDGVECKQRRWHEQGDRHQQQPDHQQ